ncbi:MAG: TRAP transporter substrate-binding protein DctP [Treponema sp.]|jgi:TRAP-type C4-dicarboxylate transport system substrate-binding protein|nr:TRAP transporter substrate-binding protein DctP [Treponema sp.]
MKFFRIAVALSLFVFAVPVFAQRTTTVKMASPVPENSPWGRFFNQIAADWKKITNGEVEMIVYHNGVAGSEKEVVRNLRVNQLQAAVLSTYGLYEISPEVMTLSCPFLIRDDDELDLVLAGLKGELEEKINGKGYFTIAWARVGWVKFFSKQPIFVPADLKKQKLGTNADQAEMNEIFKTMGFQMVPVARNDILIALNSNMVDAVFQSPVAVGSMQVFGLAKNMASINIAPFIGAVVFNQRTWRSIPEKYKQQMIDAVRKNEAELDKAIREMEDDMVKTMKNYGLKVNQLSLQQEQLWYEEIGKSMPNLIGSMFDSGVYGRIETILRNHRNGLR